MEKGLQSRLSRIHPYPGMIADEVAVDLARTYVRQGDYVLDPFAGTGRTLAAASLFGANGFGVDINPLAVIIANAKASNPPLSELDQALRLIDRLAKSKSISSREFEFNRKVEWFSTEVRRELHVLINALNRQEFKPSSWFVIGAALSATVRDVSYCRKDQWKLHRLSEQSRQNHVKSVWGIFSSRLTKVRNELADNRNEAGRFSAIRGDSRVLENHLPRSARRRGFDFLFTSPPYGDSRTTVQYGGISELCLEVIHKLKGLSQLCDNYHGIDGKCLGGKLVTMELPLAKSIWDGDLSSNGGRRVQSFLNDLTLVCESSARHMRPSSKAVFVVSRRHVNGAPLHLDKWLLKIMDQLGFSSTQIEKRDIKKKLTPSMIRPMARGSDRIECDTSSLVRTMKTEYIMLFERKP